MIGATKLNLDKVKVIKELLKQGDHTHQQIAEIFNVSRPLITQIANGKRWDVYNHSFIMKDHLETSDETKEQEGYIMTDFEIKYITEKITRMVEENQKDLSKLKRITLEFE